jgi:hypothetical protein
LSIIGARKRAIAASGEEGKQALFTRCVLCLVNVATSFLLSKHETAMNEEIRKQQVIGNFVEPIITAIGSQ